MPTELRFLFYSHDALGLGHMRRNLAIAVALADLAPEASVLLAVGTDEVNRLGLPPNVELLKLPTLRKVANERYAARHLRIPSADILALRADLLEAVVRSFRPDVMLVDKHPLGANGELLPALEALRATGRRAVLGLRDVLDSRVTVLHEWAIQNLCARIADYYGRVLVYGQRDVFDPIEEYDLPASVAARTRFCGYVVNRLETRARLEDQPPPFASGPRARPVVLATPGSGEDGFTLLETFARASSRAPWDGVMVTGPMVSEEQRQVLRRLAAKAGVACYTFIPHLARWFDLVDALVSMGGYNTLVEAVSKGVPIVCIPRIIPRSEQLIRAQAFAKLGLLRVIDPSELDVLALRRQVAAALGSSRQDLLDRANAILDFDGASQAAGHLLELAESPGRTAALQVERLLL